VDRAQLIRGEVFVMVAFVGQSGQHAEQRKGKEQGKNFHEYPDSGV
jgi:hypothetical protein